MNFICFSMIVSTNDCMWPFCGPDVKQSFYCVTRPFGLCWKESLEESLYWRTIQQLSDQIALLLFHNNVPSDIQSCWQRRRGWQLGQHNKLCSYFVLKFMTWGKYFFSKCAQMLTEFPKTWLKTIFCKLWFNINTGITLTITSYLIDM